VFMLAFVVAVLTHVPGGYGVFDVLIVHFLPEEHGASVVAALLVFRVIYYWVPLLIAGVMLGTHELTLTHDAKETTGCGERADPR
jgi:phosphatidylglycerol lysyltransferase